MSQPRPASLLFVLTLLAAACATPSDAPAALDVPVAPVAAAPETASPDPLPLRTSLKGVMIGVIDFSSHGVFQTATTKDLLSDSDWYAASVAAINLIGSASLITLPGTGDEDAAWVADPRWRKWASAFQQASVDSAKAIGKHDRTALLLAADRIARACQSCHDDFRPELPKIDVTQFASLN
jgi:hypothetical protein